MYQMRDEKIREIKSAIDGALEERNPDRRTVRLINAELEFLSFNNQFPDLEIGYQDIGRSRTDLDRHHTA